jgi:SAM-dependent methyltransferase
MAHASVFAWVQEMIGKLDPNDKAILECGSRGDSVRQFFGPGFYTSLDMGLNWPPGHVDIIANANTLPFRPDSFDVVVSTEMLEHDAHPWRSVTEMARVVRWGGWVILTARGFGYPRHMAPQDMYRFSTEAMSVLMGDASLEVIDLREDPEASGVFCLARKP